MQWHLHTSHYLEKNDLTPIITMLSLKTKMTILFNHRIDSSLIAGIRAESNNFLWEISVKKKINALKEYFKK
jgi:F0F1-type ATP synthase delta subunit